MALGMSKAELRRYAAATSERDAGIAQQELNVALEDGILEPQSGSRSTSSRRAGSSTRTRTPPLERASPSTASRRTASTSTIGTPTSASPKLSARIPSTRWRTASRTT